MPKDLPPTAKEFRFIYRFVHERDLGKAAVYAGFEAEDGKRLYNSRRIRPYLDKALEVFDREQAKLSAKANTITVDLADAELLRAAKGPLGTAKNRAIELVYERLGMRRDGNFIGPPAAETPNTANVYRALERTTVRTEQIVEREVSALPSPSAPQLPAGTVVIEAPVIEERKTNLEILDY